MTDPRPLQALAHATPFLLLEDDPVLDLLWGWREAGLTARAVRGRKMRTESALFDEMAAALQFPDYFGENWGAFDECLADMDWLPTGSGIAIVFSHPAEVLIDDDELLGVLVRSVIDAADTYSQPIERGEWWDRPAVPFHAVLLVRPGEAAAARARWEAAGATIADYGRL